jgi:hypothetical protein
MRFWSEMPAKPHGPSTQSSEQCALSHIASPFNAFNTFNIFNITPAAMRTALQQKN